MSDPNEIEIHITSKDDTDLGKLGPKYKRQGEKLGEELGKGIDKGTKKAPPITLPPVKPPPPIKIPASAENPIDAAWRQKVESSLKATAKDALNIPVTPETEGFHRELSRLLQQAQHNTTLAIPMDVKDAAKFKGEVETLAKILSDEVKVHVPVEVDKKSLKNVETATEKVAKRTESQFSAMKFAGLSAGLPAAAAIGAAGAVGALAVVPALFVGIGVSAVMSNAKVADSYSDLGTHVATSVDDMAGALMGPALEASNKLGGTFERLAPQISQAMVNSSKSVGILTDGVTGLVANAMPGLVTASKASSTALQGLSGFLQSTGTGASKMFTNLSAGAGGASSGMRVLGEVVSDAEGFLGSFLANLANGSTGPLTNFQAMLRSAEASLVTLTASGSPAVGFLNGFSNSASGALAAIRGVVGVLSLLPPGVAQVAGNVGAATMILDKFGLSVGDSFKGLGASVSAAQGFTGKLQAGLGGLIAGGLSPAGLAVGALTVGLGVLGDAQQKAAADANAHVQVQQSLATALRASNGVLNDSVRAAAATAAGNKMVGDSGTSVLQWAKDMGVALPDVVGVLTDVPGAMDRVNSSLSAHQKVTGESAQITDQFRSEMVALGKDGDLTKTKLETEATATGNVATSSGRAADGTMRLATAMDILNSRTASVSEKVTALKQHFDEINGVSTTYQDSVKTMNDAQRTLTETFGKNADKTAGWGKALINADGTVNTATANGSALYSGLQQLAGGFDNAAVSVQDLVSKGMNYDMAGQTVQRNLQAQRDEFIKTARHMELTAGQAQTLADKMGLIPGKVNTVINADVGPAIGNLTALQSRIDAIHGKTVTVATSFVDIYNANTRSQTGASRMFAKGGLVGYASGGQVTSIPRLAGGRRAMDVRPGGSLSGPGTGTSDSMLLMGSNGEFMVKASETRKHLPLLNAINNGELPASAGAGSLAGIFAGRSLAADGGAALTLTINSGGTKLDDLLVELLSKAVRVRGGNVQVVLGS